MLLLIKGLGLGGAERLLVDVVSHRDRERFDYEVAYVMSERDDLAPALVEAGVRVHCLGARASWDLRWLFALRRVLVQGRFDVVHSHLPYSAAFGRLVAWSLGSRRRPALVYTEHSLWNKAAVLTKMLNRATIGLDDALLVVSETARGALPASLGRHARVVVHGIDAARSAQLLEDRDAIRREVRSELEIADGEVLALTVANLRPEKGYDALLDAAHAVSRSSGSVRFVSVGTGPLAESLSSTAEDKGISDRLLFLGQRQDTLRLMVGSDLFVLPSHQEGLPVALMEAMSVGLPVVATIVGGVPDIVSDGAEGLLVPDGRPDLLADAIGRLAGDEGLRVQMGEAARMRSKAFGVAEAAASIEQLYGKLLADRGSSRAATDTPLVLHVIPTQVMRGAQREARALADRLDVPGVRRHRVLNLFAGPSEVRADESLDHPAGKIAAKGFDPSLLLRLRRALRRLNPSIVVAHGGDPLKYLVPVTPRGVPLVYYATGTFSGADHRFQLLLWRILVRRPAVVACEGEEVLGECRRLLHVASSRLFLAPNGRDPDRFHPPSPEEKKRALSRTPVVAFVGALNQGKGADLFVQVVRTLRLRRIPLRAWMCGDGPLKEQLVPLCAETDIDLLGARQDVDVLMREADVLVFPSRPTGEGMPGVLIEAGLSGLPVVATDVPGVRSIVEHSKTGFVVPVEDTTAMAEATASLVGIPDLRAWMGAAARRRCERQYTIEEVAKTWLAFLEPLLVGHPPTERSDPDSMERPA